MKKQVVKTKVQNLRMTAILMGMKLDSDQSALLSEQNLSDLITIVVDSTVSILKDLEDDDDELADGNHLAKALKILQGPSREDSK